MYTTYCLTEDTAIVGQGTTLPQNSKLAPTNGRPTKVGLGTRPPRPGYSKRNETID